MLESGAPWLLADKESYLNRVAKEPQFLQFFLRAGRTNGGGAIVVPRNERESCGP